jgi:sRNA-binding regulator protein Hfq
LFLVAGKVSRAKAPDCTHKEAQYLNQLSHERRSVEVRMNDGENFTGTVEFFDLTFIRVARADGPNLFLYKQDIKYLVDLDKTGR